MRAVSLKIVTILSLITLLSGCARDLSSSTYTDASTQSLTMKGVIIAARPVLIKGNDKLSENTGGMLAGGAMGAVAGSGVGGGTGNSMAIVGGAIVGGLAGAAIQGKLEESKGYEYIVEVDNSKLKDRPYQGNASMRNFLAAASNGGLITVVQGADNILNEGQKVYVIFSDNRTRVIAAR